MKPSILGDLSIEDFLANYWQKKPLVVRNAFPDFEMPFTAEELAGLTLDTDAPSRMIIEHGLPPENKPWQVKLSPFDESDFTTLPDSHCTFLVNDLERYIPELGNLIEPFRFIPDWRIDDLMVSYAEDQGTVGPHSDDYDVFLIQGEGKRRWKVITREDYPRDLIPDLPIALLKEFDEDEDWLLNAGDMLYLPPNMPHYGVAEGACFTFSVGFQAPRTVDLVQNWLETFNQNKKFTKRFSDAGRKIQDNPGNITQTDRQTLKSLMLDSIEEEKQNLDIFLGKYLTESKGDALPENHDTQSDHFSDYLDTQDYERESWLRLAYFQDGIDDKSDDKSNPVHLFADGQHITLPNERLKDIQELCENYYYSSESLSQLLKEESFKQLFEKLLQGGGIYPAN